MTRQEALSAAQAAELDLVEISPEARPPVVKIVDWGKYNYQRTKQLQKNRRNAKSLEVKQMRFGLKISDHDLGVKLRKITDFLNEGHKVKIAIVYRGRENAHIHGQGSRAGREHFGRGLDMPHGHAGRIGQARRP